MYYVKVKTEKSEFHIEITNKNVFTICPKCGAELQVDIAVIIGANGRRDLFGTPTTCSQCTQRERSK